MTRILVCILFLMMAFLWNSCSSKPTAIDQLKNEYQNPVDAMRLPEKPEEDKALQSDQPLPLETPEKRQASIDLSPIAGIKKSSIEKLIVVTEEKVPLYKGPGPKFKQMGFVHQDQKFKWLRTVKGADTNTSWHLMKDRSGQSFFISAESTRIIEKKMGSSRKVVLNSKNSADAVSPQGMFDPTPPIPQELIQAKLLTLNFEQTDIYEVITTFCELLKINYIIEGKV